MKLLTKKFTVNTYEKMLEKEIFTPQDRLELINGEIIEMSPIGLQHATTVIRFTNIFPLFFQNKALVSVQNPITLNDYSQPEPDLVLLKSRDDFYEQKRPTAEDIFLLVEVSDSTLKYDQEIKLPIYAQNNIMETWIINLNNHSVEVYRQPKNGHYQQVQIFTKKDTISCLAFPEIILKINQLIS